MLNRLEHLLNNLNFAVLEKYINLLSKNFPVGFNIKRHFHFREILQTMLSKYFFLKVTTLTI